jgi:hypothetical protein
MITLDDPRWSKMKTPNRLEIAWLLSLFGKSRKEAAGNYVVYRYLI